MHLFEAFLPEPEYDSVEVYARCFIQGDVHFNDVGHRSVADAFEPYPRDSST